MKAVDTNVLVRFLVADDRDMASRVFRLFRDADDEVFLVTTLVLLETLWVLRARYHLVREDISAAPELLMGIPVLRFESPSVVRELVAASQSSSLDLSDLLIGLHAKSLGVDATLTFDKQASRSNLFQAIP